MRMNGSLADVGKPSSAPCD